VLKKYYKYLEPIIGMMLVAIAFNLIIEPMKIAVGGTNGIAVIFERLFNIEPALFIQLFYIFTLLLSVIILGFKKTRNVLLGTVLYPLFVEIFRNISQYIKLDYDEK